MKISVRKIITATLCLAFALGYAQENSNADSALSNIQEFTPSKLLKKGQWDIKFFNSIYTQTERTNERSESVTIPRETFFTNTTEIFTGVSNSSRINVGLVFQVRSNTGDGRGALDVLSFGNNGIDSRSGLTTIAPSVRIQPFKNIDNFSLTSSFYFPVFKDRAFEGESNDPLYLDKRSYFWETKFFYDETFANNKWQFFGEADLGFNFGEQGSDANFNENNISERFANNSLFLPISAFLSYFPSEKSTVFMNGQQAFLLDLGNGFAQNSTAFGFGAKYQLTRILNVEASFNKIVRGNNFQGLGQTFSLGLRAIL
jgi:hypothetical protein